MTILEPSMSMKKFLLKLVGWREQRSDPKLFHPQDQIERGIAKEHAQEATEKEHERSRVKLEPRQAPSTGEITNPVDGPEHQG